MLRYCDFDNSKFLNSLEELGFNVSLDSRNKTIDTFTEIPNLLQLEEVNTVDMTDTAKKDNIKNPKLLIDMKKLGYKVNVLQTSGYKFIDELYADFLFDAGKGNTSFRTFDSYLYEQTVYHPFYGGQDQNIEINRMESMFKYAEDAINYGPENNFTIGYFCFPHLPYIVDEHGRKTSSTLRTDLKNPDPYLAQLKYANVKIFDLVSKIIQAQPDAIIILQSDHGFRLPSHLDHWYGIKAYDLEVESIFERNILNAVYYGGEKIDIAG